MGLFSKRKEEPLPEFPQSLTLDARPNEEEVQEEPKLKVVPKPKQRQEVQEVQEEPVQETERIDLGQLLLILQRELAQIVTVMEILSKRQELINTRIQLIEELIKKNI